MTDESKLGWVSMAGPICAVALGWGLLGFGCGTASPSPVWGDDGGGSSGSASGGSTGSGSSGGTGASSGSGSSGSSGASSSSGGAGSGSGGSGSGGGSGSSSGSGSGSGSGATGDDGGACTISSSNVRITEVDVGVSYLYQEVDANGGNTVGLAPLAISPIPSGGSRLAFIGSDSMVHIAQLDASDNLVAGSVFGLPAFDFQDIYADDKGGVVLVSRDALGGSTADHNCGNINNLCGPAATYPTNDYCWDMHMVRFDGTTETWDAKLTDTSATLPAYGVSATTGGNVVFIWWYAHNGRIAFDTVNSNYGAYFGAAITVPNAGCVTPPPTTGVNIHQGDRLKIVNTAGVVQSGGFSFGCSHSSFERITWDPVAKKFVTVCNNDAPTGGKTGRIAFASGVTTIYPVDEVNTDLGSVLPAGGGGYWVIVGDARAGQAGSPGLDDIHLLHATTGMSDKDITLVSDTGLNDRAPHLAAFGPNRMLAAWETSTKTDHLLQNDTGRKLYVQALNATTGAPEGTPYYVSGVMGSRYQDFRTYPDNSVAYAAPGSNFTTSGYQQQGKGTKIKIVRVMTCP